MTLPDRLLVISDLHLGSEDGLNIFHARDALKRFIDWAASRPGSVELVILGDGVDYLQMKPWLGYTRQVALEKTGKIIQHNQVVFDALRSFLKDSNHTLRWFIGNHDLELLFPEVRARYEVAAWGAGADRGQGRLLWNLDGEHQAYALPTGGEIHLAHGNKGDPWNQVDYAAARAIAEAGGADDFNYPPGSRLVAEVLNPLKQEGLTHIDLLKPEASVAVPLALATWPAQVGAHLRRFLKLAAQAQVVEVKDWVRPTLKMKKFTATTPPAGTKTDEGPRTAEELLVGCLAEPFITDEHQLPEQDQSGLTELINWTAPNLPPGKPATFGKTPPLIGPLLKAAIARATSGDASLLVEQRDDRATLAERNFADHAVLVVVGHTHLARAATLKGGLYLNTGTWADLMRLPRWLADEDWNVVIQHLREHLADPDHAPWYLRPLRRLTYVDICAKDKAPCYAARLCQWPADDQVELAAL